MRKHPYVMSLHFLELRVKSNGKAGVTATRISEIRDLQNPILTTFEIIRFTGATHLWFGSAKTHLSTLIRQIFGYIDVLNFMNKSF